MVESNSARVVLRGEWHPVLTGGRWGSFAAQPGWHGRMAVNKVSWDLYPQPEFCLYEVDLLSYILFLMKAF